MFKKVALSLVFLCSPVFAGELTGFEAITQDLKVGKEIRVVVQDLLCKMTDPNEYKIPPSTAVIKPSFLLFRDTILSFDVTKFANNQLPYAKNGLLERATFTLNNTGEVNIVIAFFDAVTNKKIPQWNDVTIQCQLGEGVKVYQG